MTDYKNILKGEFFFFIGFFVITIINYILPILITTMENIYPSTEIEGIIWFGAIITYVILGVIMPLIFIYEGITTETIGNPFVNIVIAITMFAFNMLLTIKAWFMITAIANMTTSTFLLAIFWVGFLITWISTVIITPISVIIKNTQNY